MVERLQKALAAAGVGSRRACEVWIAEGRVRVNGRVVTELGTKVDLETDRVLFDNRLVRLPHKRYYVALNKPRGVVSSRGDAHAGRLVTDLVDLGDGVMLRPVGRLDASSEGLIFLSDDGDFLFKLTHPRYHVPKTYRAEVIGVPSSESLDRLRQGVVLSDGLTQPAEGVRIVRATPKAGESGYSEVELTIFEGRNRQVRRMMTEIGHPVTKLTRVRIGAVKLTGLPSGAWRHLTPSEVAALTAEAETQTAPRTKSAPAASLNAPAQTHQEKPEPWPEPLPSTPPKASSSPRSLKTTRPLPQRTSSNSPSEDSMTA